jgi:hypothetical protein
VHVRRQKQETSPSDGTGLFTPTFLICKTLISQAVELAESPAAPVLLAALEKEYSF